jgi:hypothetical protein
LQAFTVAASIADNKRKAVIADGAPDAYAFDGAVKL